MNPSDTFSLHKITQGRIFVRAASNAGMTVAFGLVQVPRDAPSERVVMARLNSHLWLGFDRPVEDELASPYGMAYLGENDIGGVLTTLSFRKHSQEDALDMFLRKSHLPSDDPLTRWDIVAGVAPRSLAAAPQEGLYALGENGLTFTGISQAQYLGTTPSILMTEPIWGPSGRYGLSSSMDPAIHGTSMEAIRTENKRSDPRYQRFAEIMAELDPEIRLFYTAEQKASREAFSNRAVQMILAEEGISAAPNPG